MIKDNFVIIRSYFQTVKISKFVTFKLFLASILSHGTSLIIPLFIANIVKYITLQDYQAAYLFSGLLGLAYLFYNLFLKWSYDEYTKNTKRCCSQMQKEIIQKISEYDDHFQNEVSRGQLINTINQDVIELTKCIDRIAEYIINTISFIILIGIVATINLASAFIIFIVCSIYLILYNECNKKIVKYTSKSREDLDHISNTFSQILTGISEIKVFQLADKMLEKYDCLKAEFDDHYTKRRTSLNVRDNGITYLIYLAKVVIYILCIYLISKGSLTLDLLILLIAYYDNSLSICKDIMKNSSAIRMMSISIDRVSRIIHYQPLEVVLVGERKIPKAITEIKFDQVSFKYLSKDENILTDVSFQALPNQITALVGHTGSGKSTIGKLLLRLYQNGSGKITINGTNIYEYSPLQYKKLVSVVPQKPFIFNMSIMDNFKMICDDENRIKQICQEIGIDSFISSLANGYDTILKEDATDVSGGQKQLISVARTLMNDAQIIIFDEITSSLDPNTTKHIMTILQKIKTYKTVILITHKPDLMKIADQLVLLHKGSVVGIGNHKKLLKENSYYQELLKK